MRIKEVAEKDGVEKALLDALKQMKEVAPPAPLHLAALADNPFMPLDTPTIGRAVRRKFSPCSR